MTLGKPVASIPSNVAPGAPKGSGRNQRMLEQFMKSGNPAQMVNYGPMNARNARTAIGNCIRQNNLPIRVIMRGASIYLARKPVTDNSPIAEI